MAESTAKAPSRTSECPHKPRVFLKGAVERCPALGAVLERLDQESDDIIRATIRRILRDALWITPYYPELTRAQGDQMIRHDTDRQTLTDSELTWLAQDWNRLYHRWQGRVFRYLSGYPVAKRERARYYLALVARLYRLENTV